MAIITKLPNGGELHEFTTGNKEWYLNNLRHREDGPAIEHATGYKSWYLNGKWHREDGPAIIFPGGKKQLWFLNGIQINCQTQEEFKTLMRLRAFW